MNLLEPLKKLIEPEYPSITQQGLDVKIVDFRAALLPGVDYFNSSLVALPDRDWLVVRRSKFDPNIWVGKNDLVAFAMNRDVPQVGRALTPQLLNADEHCEDPLAIYHEGHVWVGACNFRWFTDKWTGAHQALFKFDTKWNCLKRYDPVYGHNLDRCSGIKGHEKNWLWFFHGGRLYMVYRAEPHTVVQFDQNVKAIAEHKTEWQSGWEWGEIRGGTSPTLAGDGLYWTFFHSSKPWRGGKRRYVMGAYAFEPKPPFKVVAITVKPLLIGSTYDRWHKDKPPCVFSRGATYRGDRWTISGGVNDFDSFICHLPHSDLLGLVRSV